jgi:hypothetical protein
MADFIDNATKVTSLVEEKISGTTCYVIQAKPAQSQILNFMLAQSQTTYTIRILKNEANIEVNRIPFDLGVSENKQGV